MTRYLCICKTWKRSLYVFVIFNVITNYENSLQALKTLPLKNLALLPVLLDCCKKVLQSRYSWSLQPLLQYPLKFRHITYVTFTFTVKVTVTVLVFRILGDTTFGVALLRGNSHHFHLFFFHLAPYFFLGFFFPNRHVRLRRRLTKHLYIWFSTWSSFKI